MKWTDAHQQLVQWSRSGDALTESQRITLAAIQEAIAAGVPYINLFGKPGVGKTFLAKHLAHTQQCVYLSGPTSQPSSTVAGRCVLIDNVGPGRHEVRSTCNAVLAQGARTAVVITQARVLDSFMVFELTLTPIDAVYVYDHIGGRRPGLSLQAQAHNDSGLWALVANWAETDSR